MAQSLPCRQRTRIRFRAGYEFLITRFFPEIRRDGEAELQSLVSVPNISGLHPKSLLSAYKVKSMCSLLLIAIRPSDGDVKPGGPLEIGRAHV